MTRLKKLSREESQTKIEDELISPYVIYFDSVSYTVVKPKNKGQDENISYHTRFDGALKSIAKLLINEQKTVTIKEFIEKYEQILNSISERFKI